MPQIPVLSERQGARTVTTPGVTRGAAIGFNEAPAGLRRLGGGVSRVGDAMVQQVAEAEEQRYRAERAAFVNDATGQFAQFSGELLDEMKRTTEPGALEFTQRYNDLLTAEVDRLSQSTDQATSTAVRNTLSNMQRGRIEQAMSFEAGEKVAFERSKIVETSRTLANEAAASPELLEMFRDHGRASILDATGSLTPSEQRKLLADWDQQVTGAAVRGLIREAPLKAKDRLESGEFDSVLDPEVKASLINSAENRYKIERTYQMQMQDREERLAEKAQKQAQDLNYSTSFVGVLRGETSRDDVINMIDAGDVTVSQGRTLLNAFEEDASWESNPSFLIEMTHQVEDQLSGPMEVLDGYDQKLLSTDDAETLLKRAHALQKTDATAEEKSQNEVVKREAGNLRKRLSVGETAFAGMPPDVARRVTMGMREYYERIDRGEDPSEAADAVATRMGGSVSAVTQTMPSPQNAYGLLPVDPQTTTQEDIAAARRAIETDPSMQGPPGSPEYAKKMEALRAISERNRLLQESVR